MVKSSERTKREIIKAYNNDPEDWRVLVGRDTGRHLSVVISHGEELWIVKEEQINPYKSIGYGAKTYQDAELLKNISPYTFGFRPLTTNQIEELTTAMEKKKSINEILTDLMAKKPVSFKDIASPMVIQGPVVHSPKPIDYISDKHRQLDLKLKFELEKLLHRKYPQTVLPYL